MSFRKRILLSDFFLSLVLFSLILIAGNIYFERMQLSEIQKKECKAVLFSLFLIFTLLHRGIGVLMINKVLKPIQQIVKSLSSFKEGEEELLPQIGLKAAVREGEFNKLASILNALIKRIQRQIENLTKQKEETKKILESLGEGIIALDPSARITFANEIACAMLKTTKDQILGKTLKQVNSDLSLPCHELVLHALQTSEPASQALEKGHLSLISAPLAHQEGALLVLQDKTSDYQVIRMGKDFVANASHELRTPITIIRGFAETLQDVPDLSKDTQKEITEKIVKTCMRLEKLVRSLLTLTDVENLSTSRLKKTELISLVENCVHLMKIANPTAKISISSNCEAISLLADADLLELAISNILENGIKYSKDSANLEVRIEKCSKEVHVLLKDRGIGIPEEDLIRIFDRFYTVNKARSRKYGGAGLGLSIVKTIIEKHKGRVTASSEKGKGSMFTLTLPY